MNNALQILTVWAKSMDWTNEEKIPILTEFITRHCDLREFGEYLKRMAQEEMIMTFKLEEQSENM